MMHTASRNGQSALPSHSSDAPHTRPPPSAALWTQAGFSVRAEDSPVWLGEEELWPISCHGGRLSGVGGQLRRCPLRVRIVGLDEGDVVQQGGVGRAENLLSHLLWIVWCHLQVRQKRGARSSKAHRFQTPWFPDPNSNPRPTPQPWAPQSLWGT